MDNITTTQKVLIGILVVMLGYLAYDIWFGGNTPDPVQSTTRAVVPSQKASGGNSVANASTPSQPGSTNKVQMASVSNPWFRNFSHDSWKNDPFKHPTFADDQNNSESETGDGVVSQVLSSRFQLTAISKRGQDAYVLINNEVLTVGDVIDGAELLEIRSNSVVMDYRGNNIIVHLTTPKFGAGATKKK